MTDEELKKMTKDEANEHLSLEDKRRWVKLHNTTANLYFLKKEGHIEDVPSQGWWY